jgi:hypothetical protein
MKVTINAMTFEGTPEEIDAVVRKYGHGRTVEEKAPPVALEKWGWIPPFVEGLK